jgi:hypothetical protein
MNESPTSVFFASSIGGVPLEIPHYAGVIFLQLVDLIEPVVCVYPEDVAVVLIFRHIIWI